MSMLYQSKILKRYPLLFVKHSKSWKVFILILIKALYGRSSTIKTLIPAEQ